MSGEKHYCPHCGSETHGEPFCPNCGSAQTTIESGPAEKLTTSDGVYSNQMDAAPYYNASTWNKLEKWVAFVGYFSWILLILNVSFTIADTMIENTAYITLYRNSLGTYTPMAWDPQVTIAIFWVCLSVLITIILGAIFVKPFAKGCKHRDWDGLVNDVFKFGKYRIPKMLIVGIILEMSTYGWGGLFVLVPAILIVLIGPIKTHWIVQNS